MIRTASKLIAVVLLCTGIAACAVYPQARYHDNDGYRPAPYAHRWHGGGWGYRHGYADGRGWRGRHHHHHHRWR